MLAAGTVISGQYQVTGLLGKGGMSYVHNAKHLPTGRPLVIKEAIKRKTKNDQTMIQSLATEGNLLKKLTNPHLPRIYDVIEETDQIMIVMDFVEGTSLDKVLEKNGALPMEQVINIGIQICDVFHYLHTQHPPIIYRDMKPANVILQSNGNVMMIDFGTARMWKGDGDRTSDTMLIGTEGFAAPEQYGGIGESDSRTDIFCIGATLFNLVTNHSPYIKPFGITPLGDWNQLWDKCMLDCIIQKCTERDPDLRFQSVMELKNALLEAEATPLGKTGLLSKLGLNKTPSGKLSGQGWSAPNMTVSSGFSEELIQRNADKYKTAHTGGTQPFTQLDPGTEPLKQYANTMNTEWKTSTFTQVTTMQMTANSSNNSQGSLDVDSAAANDTLKLIAMIILIIGLGLVVISLVLLKAMPTAAIILLILGLLAFVTGAVCAVMYLKG